jgi:hypothetical protein
MVTADYIWFGLYSATLFAVLVVHHLVIEYIRSKPPGSKSMADIAFQVPTANLSTPGVDVMITIFCDFPQFSAKKLAFFLKNQCFDQFFSKIWLCFE